MRNKRITRTNKSRTINYIILTSISFLLIVILYKFRLYETAINMNNKKIIGQTIPIVSYIKMPKKEINEKNYYRKILANKTIRFEVFDFREEDYYEETKQVEKDNIIQEEKPMVNIDELGKVKSVTLSSKNMIKNETKYNVDIEAIKSQKLDIKLGYKKIEALIYHTHATESYTPTLNNNYVASGTFRTLNTKSNMIKVGEVLKESLERRRIKTFHDCTLYDASSFNGAYGRSYKAVKGNIQKNKGIKLVFDVHRDAIGIGAERYRPIVKIDGKEVAQILLVVGTDAGGLTHEKWKENLNLAIKLKETSDKLYPGLIRQINIRKERFNQNLSTGSLIVEMGATGNTIEEASLSAELFGEIIEKTLK